MDVLMRLKGKVRQSIRRVQDAQQELTLKQKREELLSFTQQIVINEFEDEYQLPKPPQIDHDTEQKFKACLDGLRALNQAKRARVDVPVQPVARMNRSTSSFQTSTTSQSSRILSYDDPTRRFKLASSTYIPNQADEIHLAHKLNELQVSSIHANNALVESQSMSEALHYQSLQIKDDIDKLATKCHQTRQQVEELQRKEKQFKLMYQEIRAQEHDFKAECKVFTDEVAEIDARAAAIKENKSTVLHNLSVLIKQPKQNYIEGRMMYQELVPKQQQQQSIILELTQQENDLNAKMERLSQAGRYIQVLLKLKHLLFDQLIAIDWEGGLAKLAQIRPRNLLALAVISTLAKLKNVTVSRLSEPVEDETTLLNYIDLLYVEYPKGPQHLVSKLLHVHDQMKVHLNIRIVDTESLNELKNKKLEELSSLEANSLEEPLKKQGKYRLDLGELGYLTNNSTSLNTITHVRQLVDRQQHFDTFCVRIFYGLFEHLIKVLQMIDITHAKMTRYQISSSLNVDKQMEFIFWLKDQLTTSEMRFRDEVEGLYIFSQTEANETVASLVEMVRTRPLVELFCKPDNFEEYFLRVKSEFNNSEWQTSEHFKQIARAKLHNLQARAEQNFLEIVHGMLMQFVDVMAKVKSVCGVATHTYTSPSHTHYKKLQEAQRQVVERLQSYTLTDLSQPILSVRPKKTVTERSQQRIVHFANEMQLDQIRNLKSSIIIKRRKKEAFKTQEQRRRQRHLERTLDVEAGEQLYLSKTQSAIKHPTGDEDRSFEDQGLIDQINALQAIQHNKTHGVPRLWSQQIHFNQQNMKTIMNTQYSLLDSMVKSQNSRRLTVDRKSQLKRFLGNMKMRTLSEQKELRVARLKQEEARKSFIVFTSRSEYLKQQQLGQS